MTEKKKIILEAVEKLTDTYRKEELFLGKDRERLPNKKEIINFIKDMRSIIFPGYFSVDSSAKMFPEHYVAYRLNDLYDCLQEQIEVAFLYQGEPEQQAKDLIQYIGESGQRGESIWETNIFGKTVEQLVNDGIRTKISMIGEESQEKLQDTMQKIVNDSNGGLVCIII